MFESRGLYTKLARFGSVNIGVEPKDGPCSFCGSSPKKNTKTDPPFNSNTHVDQRDNQIPSSNKQKLIYKSVL
jgi:hypothetical protein